MCYISKNHRELITYTATIIPNIIPIPQAMLEYHLSCTSENLVHLLHRKQDILNPGPSKPATYTLLKIAKILQRDSTPVILPNSHTDGIIL